MVKEEKSAEPKAKPTAAEERSAVFDDIIELNPYSVQICDAEGHHIRANKAFKKLFGSLPPSEWSIFNDLLLKKAGFSDLFKKLKKGETIRISAIWYNAHDVSPRAPDNPICLGATHFPIFDDKGNLKIIVNMHEDITNLKRAQDEAVVAKSYVESIIKSMIDTLIVVDPDGKIKTINKATEELLGYTEDELLGKPVGILFAEEEEEEDDDDDTLFKGTRWEKLLKEGLVRDYSMTYRTKTGEKIPVSFSGSVMRDKDGNLVGIVGVAKDMREILKLQQKEKEFVSEQIRSKTLEEAKQELEKKVKERTADLEDAQLASLNIMEDLERRRKELEDALKKLRETQTKLIQSEKLASVGQLAAGVAHEINNPLASILLGAQRMSDMIKKQVKAIPGSKVYLRNLERMEKSTNRCKKIVAGLLAFSRPTKIGLGPTDINKVIEETLEPLEEQVKAQYVKVIKGFAPSLPIIEADGQQLSQVFNNLIVNACEAMPKGGQLRIITRLQTPEGGVQSDASGEVGKTVEIEFSDTGKGMPEEDVLRIFDPFFTTKEVGKGVGLGLSISYAIVEEHGGTIEVRSKKGKGTTFIVRFPVKI